MEALACVGFALIVALILQLALHNGDSVLEVKSSGEQCRPAQDDGEVGQVAADTLRHARELHLHRNVRAIRQGGAVHLSNRSGGDGRAVEREKLGLPIGPKFRLHDRVELPFGHVVCMRLDLGEHTLQLGRQDRVVLDAHELAELERRAAHSAKRRYEAAHVCVAHEDAALPA